MEAAKLYLKNTRYNYKYIVSLPPNHYNYKYIISLPPSHYVLTTI